MPLVHRLLRVPLRARTLVRQSYLHFCAMSGFKFSHLVHNDLQNAPLVRAGSLTPLLAGRGYRASGMRLLDMELMLLSCQSILCCSFLKQRQCVATLGTRRFISSERGVSMFSCLFACDQLDNAPYPDRGCARLHGPS